MPIVIYYNSYTKITKYSIRSVCKKIKIFYGRIRFKTLTLSSNINIVRSNIESCKTLCTLIILQNKMFTDCYCLSCAAGVLLCGRFAAKRRKRLFRNKYGNRRSVHENSFRSRKARRVCPGSRGERRSAVCPTQQWRSTKFRYTKLHYKPCHELRASVLLHLQLIRCEIDWKC